MKLIIRQYLASLKEREELDAILPDLLSELGLNVYSRPGRGGRQAGVDVAAVGSLNGESEKVYLFSIKAGDLTRSSWNGDALQSLRPSLDEIRDLYITCHLPVEHRGKNIVVCLCFGGDIQEHVRPQIEGYIQQHKSNTLSFEEWNGDKLASLIQASFLREELMPVHARSQLRKSLSLLDEPESSYRHFSALIRALSAIENKSDKELITAIRQINICLWILFAWAREAGNTESAYLAGELVLLHGWEITKAHIDKKNKTAQAILQAFDSILLTYQQICFEYLEKIRPHTHKRHALSAAVRTSCSVDINLRLFDVLGRLAMGGIWNCWALNHISDKTTEAVEQTYNKIQSYATVIKQLILNNPTLFLPIKDNQAIDICITVLLLAVDRNNDKEIIFWLSEMVDRADFTMQTYGQYPCNINSYSDLLDHPKKDDGYLKESTSGSILYPIVALCASLFNDEQLYAKVQSIKKQLLKHCNFQYWYPDENSEKNFYTNNESHGATLSHVCIERSYKEFMEQMFEECKNTPAFDTLSAVKAGLWPIILIACRHYRLPVPLHLFQRLHKSYSS